MHRAKRAKRCMQSRADLGYSEITFTHVRGSNTSYKYKGFYMNDMVKNLILWAVIVVVLMSVFDNFSTSNQQTAQITYSQFITEVRSGQIKNVNIDSDNRTITGQKFSGEAFTTFSPGDNKLVDELLNSNVEIATSPSKKRSLLMDIFISWFPMLLLIGLWIFLMRQMQGGGGGRGGAMSFGKSKARLIGEDQIKVTFSDVAGVEEAKGEVSELVEAEDLS